MGMPTGHSGECQVRRLPRRNGSDEPVEFRRLDAAAEKMGPSLAFRDGLLHGLHLLSHVAGLLSPRLPVDPCLNAVLMAWPVVPQALAVSRRVYRPGPGPGATGCLPPGGRRDPSPLCPRGPRGRRACGYLREDRTRGPGRGGKVLPASARRSRSRSPPDKRGAVQYPQLHGNIVDRCFDGIPRTRRGVETGCVLRTNNGKHRSAFAQQCPGVVPPFDDAWISRIGAVHVVERKIPFAPRQKAPGPFRQGSDGIDDGTLPVMKGLPLIHSPALAGPQLCRS